MKRKPLDLRASDIMNVEPSLKVGHSSVQIANVIVCSIGLVASLAKAIALWRLRKLWGISDVIHLSMSLSFLPVYSSAVTLNTLLLVNIPAYDIYMSLVVYTGIAIVSVHMIALMVDRFLAAFRPLWYKARVSKRHLLPFLVIIWSFWIALYALIILLIDFNIARRSKRVPVCISGVASLGAGTSLAVCYYFIIRRLRASRVRLAHSISDQQSEKRKLKERNMTIMSCLVTAALYVCVYPYLLTAVIDIHVAEWLMPLGYVSGVLISMLFFTKLCLARFRGAMD